MIALIRFCFALLVFVALFPTIGCRESVTNDVQSMTHQRSLLELATDVQTGKSQSIQLQIPTNDSEFSKLPDALPVTQLFIEEGELTDASVGKIANWNSLEQLRIRLSPIENEGFLGFLQLTHLIHLNLPHAKINDDIIGLIGKAKAANTNENAAKHVETSVNKFAKLELLRFGSPDLTDKGLNAILETQPDLRFLHLINVNVTDSSIEFFVKLEKLESLYVDGGAITNDGFSRLVSERPDLHIHVDQKHLDGTEH